MKIKSRIITKQSSVQNLFQERGGEVGQNHMFKVILKCHFSQNICAEIFVSP